MRSRSQVHRVETVRRLAGVLASRQAAAFPPAAIALDGWMEQLIAVHPAAEIEERYRAVLRDNRMRDAAAGRTLDGPHLTDLKVIYARLGQGRIPVDRVPYVVDVAVKALSGTNT